MEIFVYRFFVIANAIGSVYTLVLLFPPTKSMLGLITVALDLIITMLLTSSISATLAIAYIGKKGNSHAGWLPICNETPKFCNHVSGALLAGCVGVILHMILLLQSIHSVLNPLLL
ncbi:hypothetical protein IFM89_010205 [Coptis chinensis]|uniref:CASP-like protein n=1 Tax=Coptis chinensis TaxID=261450 RepID=A0A835LID8_9MAGN|nr:hypothetical protein IFM89_010205 [Coptis chinensis]